jgi:hypothetical protein
MSPQIEARFCLSCRNRYPSYQICLSYRHRSIRDCSGHWHKRARATRKAGYRAANRRFDLIGVLATSTRSVTRFSTKFIPLPRAS